MKNMTLANDTVITVSAEDFDNMTVTNAEATAQSVTLCNDYTPELNALVNEFNSQTVEADSIVWNRAKLIAKYDAKDEIWTNNGFKNRTEFFESLGLKKQTISNMAVVGNRPDLLKLRGFGLSFTQVYELSSLKPEQVRDAIISGSVDKTMTCSQIREIVRSIKGLPEKTSKSKNNTVTTVPEKPTKEELINAITEGLISLKNDFNIDTDEVIQLLRSKILDSLEV